MVIARSEEGGKGEGDARKWSSLVEFGGRKEEVKASRKAGRNDI
jgi:hypothetical protein